MADAVVNILFQNLKTFLIEESLLLRGTHGNFEEIKKEIDSMRSFLRESDRRKDSHEGLRTWVGQVRAAAHNVEDIIDEFTYRMNRPQRSGCTHYILQTICLPKMIFHRHQLATRLQEVKSQIVAISERKDRYQLSRIEDVSTSDNAAERWQYRDGASLFMDHGEIVGLDQKINELVDWLRAGDLRRSVIAIVGMGGLGKTTLVAQAYRKEKVREHFDCSVWVSVSQSYRVEEVLKRVINDLFRANEVEPPSGLHSMNQIQLLDIVNEYLAMKRYVVVLDDVWAIQAWRELNVAFPRNSLGSRIMLTTRYKNVAFGLGDGSCAYQLEPLQEKDAWDLFCKNAFWKEPCPKELEPLARRVLWKCQGLPLAIVTLGSLFSFREKTIAEWNKVYNNLRRQLSNNSELEPIKNILLLSFYDLPYNLKHCFLYCCVFPEDYLICRKRLIRLWVAEGFIADEDRISMEEAAEDYLKELIHRNMLQVVETNNYERFKCFQVHDIVREVALSVSKEEKFCVIWDGHQASRGEGFRRVSIHKVGEITCSPTIMSRMRSVLVFDESDSFSSSLNMMISSFRLIRVLNLEGVPIKRLPDEVSNLFNLQYLNLRGTKVNELPKSLGRLQNMQTLDLRETKVEKLPTEIGNLKKLHHLFCYRLIDSDYKGFEYRTAVKVPLQVCKLTSLQSLLKIEAKGDIAKQIGNLAQLRRLSIAKVRAADGVELCDSIKKMNCLVRLVVRANDEEEVLDLEQLLPNPPPLLQKLALLGHLEKVPQWLGSLANLTRLSLRWSRLREEEGRVLLLMLQALPNLELLYLHQAYEGLKILFQDGWFAKLKTLIVMDFTQLSQVVIEKGAMPCVQSLYLRSCRELKALPQGIEHLVHLQELILREMPMELVDKLRPINGNEEDRQKVAQVPIIQHQWMSEDGKWKGERLN